MITRVTVELYVIAVIMRNTVHMVYYLYNTVLVENERQ